MNEEKPVEKSTCGNAAPSAAEVAGAGAATKSHRVRALRLDSTAFSKLLVGSSPAPVQVIDDNLEEEDLAVSIQVEAISRVEKLAGFKLARTLYGGAKSQTLLTDLDKLIQEAYEATAIKLNRKLRPKDAQDAGKNASSSLADSAQSPAPDDGEILLKNPLPLPYPRDGGPNEFFPHLDAR